MTRLSRLGLVMLMMIAVAGSAHAADFNKPTLTKVIHGVLTGESGEQIKFSVPEGRGLLLKERGNEASYHLVVEALSSDRVTFKVLDSATEQPVDRFEVGLNGKPKSGTILPISLSFTGVTVESRTTAPRLQQPSSLAAGSCCVGCGSWEVCCYPSPGWCCTLECVGGDICGACSAQ